MPLLKKFFVKPRSAPGSQLNKISKFKNFKTPLLTRENIDNILSNNNFTTTKVNRTAYSQPTLKTHENKTSTASNISKKHKVSKKTTQLNRTSSNASSVSIHLSFGDAAEKVTDESDGKSDISYRMNEPRVKEAYLQFVKKLSQSSSNESKLPSSPKTQISQGKIVTPMTSSPVNEKSQDMFKTPPERSIEGITKGKEAPITNSNDYQIHSSLEENKKSPRKIKKTLLEKYHKKGISSPKKSNKNKNKNLLNQKSIIKDKSKNTQKQKMLFQNTSLSLSQEMLNQQDVKAAYVNFMKSSLENDEDIIKLPRVARKRNKTFMTSSDEDSLNTSENENTGIKKIRATRAGKNKKVIKRKINVDSSEEDCYKNLTTEQRMALIQESRNVGLYVLCDICNKARYLPDVKDPLELPDKWYCAMHPDEKYNKCSYPEEVQEESDYLIDNLYNAGSIVWARMYGYPWWPAMVEDDVDTETYFWLGEKSNAPTWYHVTFFDSVEVTRAWMKPSCLRPFKINMNNPTYQTTVKSGYKFRVSAAMKQAAEATDMPLIDRLKKYSFIYRYNKPFKTRERNLKKRVRSTKQATKQKKVYKSLLVGHTMNCSKEMRRSTLEVDVNDKEITSDKELTNDKELKQNNVEPANNTDDISVILNNFDWTDTQNLSFNLLD